MKKSIVFLFFSLVLTSCNQSINESDVIKINGYWEIEKVILENGDKKDYKINETIDFFELHKAKNSSKIVGFRKKVMPQLDGTYLTNNSSETISLTIEKGVYYINYVTNYAKWKEEIIKIKDSVLVLKNGNTIEYHYKRPIPFSLK